MNFTPFRTIVNPPLLFYGLSTSFILVFLCDSTNVVTDCEIKNWNCHRLQLDVIVIIRTNDDWSPETLVLKHVNSVQRAEYVAKCSFRLDWLPVNSMWRWIAYFRARTKQSQNVTDADTLLNSTKFQLSADVA